MELDKDIVQDIEKTRLKYDFLTFLVLEDDIIVGIVQNETPKLMMVYQLDAIRDPHHKETFLKYADEWWWESNRTVPINSFIGRRFDMFEACLKGYSKKSVLKVIGPTFNLAERYLKRIKKKRIDIMKNV